MNVLFVNYGNFTTNSLNHISGFAAALQQAGHACAVAVPDELETLAAVPNPCFKAVTYAEVLAAPAIFPDHRPADIIHAWTPREQVRKFVLALKRSIPARLIIHLEDNEDYLLSAFARRPFADLRQLTDDELAACLDGGLSHPVRYPNFLRTADAVTVITESLQQFAPHGIPRIILPPGVDFSLYNAAAPSAALRSTVGIGTQEHVITFTGSTTFANQDDMRDLVSAVHLLNQRGVKTRLIRTGFHPDEFTKTYDFDWRSFTLDLGFVAKRQLPELIALADVLVQPGHPGAFNDYRLPSKLPEFLASGRPVILPAANLAHQLRDQTDALILKTGDPAEIADLCQQIFSSPELAERLASHGAAFARQHFDINPTTARLIDLYEKVSSVASRSPWSGLAEHTTESSLIPRLLAAEIERLLPASDSRRAALLATLEDLALTLQHGEIQAARGPARALIDKLHVELARQKSRGELAQQHASNLQATLDEARQNLAAAQGEISRIARSSRLYHGELMLSRSAAAEREARLNEQLRKLQLKIERREATFSWRVTAPLRFLRRNLIDPFLPQKAPAAPPPAQIPPAATPPADQFFRFHIDEPAHWYVPAGLVTLTGWCLDRDKQPAKKIRVLLGERPVAGEAGLSRLDVVSRFDHAAAEHSGFRLQLHFTPGLHHFRIEALGADQVWHLLATPELQVFDHPEPALGTYEQWLAQYGQPSPKRIQAWREQLAGLAGRPRISILLPVYNTPERWLRRAITSVQEQLYGDWELCIADDASTASHVRPVLEAFAASDQRIKVLFRPANGHISAASNSALELATGSFCALLDHDDELPIQALARVVMEINRHPDAAFIFSDEDKIDELGRHFDPYFKPDYLPDLFHGQNCLSHLSVIRTDLIRQVGGFRVGLEGSQDWDLGLRIIELITPNQIRHIPEVLYHWRAIAGSTALAINEKDYCNPSAHRALTDHFARQNLPVTLEPVPGNHWKIAYPLPDPAPLVSLIIPTRDRLALVRACVESILEKTSYPNFEILIIDNGSNEPATLEWFAAASRLDPRVKILPYPAPFNFSALNNFGVKQAAGSIVGLLNNDLEVINPHWLTEMVGHAVRPEIGAVGAMLYYPDGTIQHAGVVLGLGGVANHAFYGYPRGTHGYMNRARLAQNFSAVTGACLLIRREIYEQVGGLNEKDLAVAFNDIDFCLKVRAAGYRNLWTPFAELIHHESASRGTEDTSAKKARFASEVDYMQRTWGQELATDPAYNPNLSLDIAGFHLAFPPRSEAV